MRPPKPPSGRLISETALPVFGEQFCSKCGSSIKANFLFFSTGKCINPDCKNYYNIKKLKEERDCYKCGFFDEGEGWCCYHREYVSFPWHSKYKEVGFKCPDIVEKEELRVLARNW